MSNTKRFLAIVLALVMVASMVPATALADELPELIPAETPVAASWTWGERPANIPAPPALVADMIVWNWNFPDADYGLTPMAVPAPVEITAAGAPASVPAIAAADLAERQAEGYWFAGWYTNASWEGVGLGRLVRTGALGAGIFPTGSHPGAVAHALWVPYDHVRWINTTHNGQTQRLSFSTASGVTVRRMDNNDPVDVEALLPLNNGFCDRADCTDGIRDVYIFDADGNRLSIPGTDYCSDCRTATVPFGVYLDLANEGDLLDYLNWSLPWEERAADLAPRLTIEQISGMMLISGHQTAWGAGAAGNHLATNYRPTAAQRDNIDNNLRQFLIAGTGNFSQIHARWNNNSQALAQGQGLGIPLNNCSDPRHSPAIGVEFYSNNLGTMSLWPTTLGLAANMCVETVMHFSKIAGAEYRANGISTALHPHIDLAADTRWTRYSGTFGEDPRLSSYLARAYTIGWQGTFDGAFDDFTDDTGRFGRHSVNGMMKHWPGGAPTEEGRDAHNEFGAYGVYPGGMFEAHLSPFVFGGLQPADGSDYPTLGIPAQADPAIGVATAVMPYYQIPNNIDPTGINRAVAFSNYFNRYLLRETFGFDGLICTDWQVDGSRGLGADVENAPGEAGVDAIARRSRMLIEAGVNQFGGQANNVNILNAYRNSGPEDSPARLAFREMMEESVQFNLRNVFLLDLFDDPFVCVAYAHELTDNTDGENPNFEAGYAAQIASTVLVTNTNDLLPLEPETGINVFIPTVMVGGSPRHIFGYTEEFGFNLVDDPALADVAIFTINSPYLTTASFGGGFAANTGYVPLASRFAQYTATTARPVSLAGDWRNLMTQPAGTSTGDRSLNRSILNHTSRASGNSQTRFNMLLDLRETLGPDVPIITIVNVDNPFVMREIEYLSDAIMFRFASYDTAVWEVLSGNYAPNGLLPFQMPANVTAVQAQNEDEPRSFRGDEIHTCADGNVLDFTFGLTWDNSLPFAERTTFQIDDERVAKFNVPVAQTPRELGLDHGMNIPLTGLDNYATINTLVLPWAVVGEPFEYTLDVTDGGTARFIGRITGLDLTSDPMILPAISPDLPAGLTWDPATFTISGTPTAPTLTTSVDRSTFNQATPAGLEAYRVHGTGQLGNQLLFDVDGHGDSTRPGYRDRQNYRLTLVVTEPADRYIPLPDMNDLAEVLALTSRSVAQNWTPASWLPFQSARFVADWAFLDMTPVGTATGTFGSPTLASRDEIIEHWRNFTVLELNMIRREAGQPALAHADWYQAPREQWDQAVANAQARIDRITANLWEAFENLDRADIVLDFDALDEAMEEAEDMIENRDPTDGHDVLWAALEAALEAAEAVRNPALLPYPSQAEINAAYRALRAAMDALVRATIFPDLASDHWARPYALEAADRGIVNGIWSDEWGTHIFHPYGSFNRAMAAMIMWNTAGSPEPEGTESPFADVAADMWYTDAIIWAAENDVVSGHGDGTFTPYASLTRQQLFVLLWNFAREHEELDVEVGDLEWPYFSDHDDLADWADAAAQWLTYVAFLQGTGDGYLQPLNDTNRAEGATLVIRFVRQFMGD